MELKHNISDYTEAEFLEFVKKICRAEGTTEEDDNKSMRESEGLTKHLDGSDLAYHPRDSREGSPEGIVKETKEWGTANGKSGSKQGGSMNAGCLWMNGWHSFMTRSRYEKNNRDYFIASCGRYSVCMSDKLCPGCSERGRISVINSGGNRINNAVTRNPLGQK